MRRVALCLVILLLVVAVRGTVAQATPIIESELLEKLPVGRSFHAICMLTPGAYAVGGEQSTGGQPWEVEPSIATRGSSAEANIYYYDGVDVSDIKQGTVVSFEMIEEVTVATGGFTAEYGAATGAILDYQNGGTGVYNVITKRGTNEFRAEFMFYTEKSLNDLAYDSDDTLWGAGMDFGETGPAPVLGYFDEDGFFIPIGSPLDTLSGYFQGIEFSGFPVAYGSTMADAGPTKPLMVFSYNAGQTWELPPMLPWEYGTIYTAQYVDPYLWVAGETPDGAAFAYTSDGGNTWMKQTMHASTYIWDMEIALVDPSVCRGGKNWLLGAALGTHYLDDGSKESIVFRTLDGLTWEELWRVPGYGGAIDFDALWTGTVAMVQNGSGGATFSQYAAHDFFGAHNLICNLELVPSGDMATIGEPFSLQLEPTGPWGAPIMVDPSVSWWADVGDLVVDAQDPFRATLTVSEPIDVTITCTLPDLDLETTLVVPVQPPGD